MSETGHPNEMGEIDLSQFSAAMVPKYDKEVIFAPEHLIATRIVNKL